MIARIHDGGPRTLFDKLWDAHLIGDLGGGESLIHIDRHLLHELSSPQAFAGLRARALPALSPELAVAVSDHIVETAPRRDDRSVPGGTEMIRALRDNAAASGIRFFGVGSAAQGIVHVVAAERGIALPGMTIACGDSHTCTLGALGSWAFGVGTSEVEHILATQTLAVRKPARLRLTITGVRGPGVTAKDLALGIIARFGVDAARGGVLEFAGPGVTALTMAERFTLCNLAIEASARSALIAPDRRTFDYVRSLPCPPPRLVAAISSWRRLRSDAGAEFDRDLAFDCSDLAPQISWGTNPGQTMDVDGTVPAIDPAAPAREREAAARALAYMGLEPGQRLRGVPIQNVFIGSCTNARLSDLSAAAAILRGRRVAPGVRALAVPGSTAVKREAERLGIDRIFIDAGFEWRESGCSMCIGMNSDRVPPGERCVSTSNRNFEGRQGPGARTHLASPISAAAAAVTGRITDVRELLAQ